MLDEYHYFYETFDNDFFDLIGSDLEVEIFDKIKPELGDVVIYDYNTKKIKTLNKERCGKEIDNAIIGVVVQLNDDNTMDVLCKNYITESVRVPTMYINKPKFIPAYLKDLFDRYCGKYKRTSQIDLSIFNYLVPPIALLDFVYKKLNIFTETLKDVYGEEYVTKFLDRLYYNGLFSFHKNRYFRWLPKVNEKRVIQNIEAPEYIEFLPICTVNYDMM